jgi:hypothetical protein
MMQLQALERKRQADNQINWVTAFFMAAFHLGVIVALFFLLGKLCSLRCFCGGYREASASGWAIIGYSRIVVTELQSGSSMF